MDKFFYTVGLVFCILLAFSGMFDLVQNEIAREMVVGILKPLKSGIFLYHYLYVG